MATFTQHKQPYGPLARRIFLYEGTSYDVVRGDKCPHGRKYALRITGVSGKPEAFVYVKECGDSEAMMTEAKRRLLGC